MKREVKHRMPGVISTDAMDLNPKGIVRFYFGNGWEIDVMITNDGKSIKVVETGGYGLVIEPVASNCINIRGTHD